MEGAVTTIDWKARAEAAERTVAVLKRKVSALYNGEGLSGVQRQLERTLARQIEAEKRRARLEARASELTKHAHELEAEVAARTADLRLVLDNVHDAFFVSDTTLTVWPGHSRSCRELLGAEEIVGRSAVDLLAAGDVRMVDALTLTLRQLCEDVLPEEVLLDSVPKRIVLHDRILRLGVRTIRRAGVIEKLLWTLSDATLLEQAQRHADENQVLLGILSQKAMFMAFVAEARQTLTSMRTALHGQRRGEVLRDLHTLKGNAAAFDLAALVGTIHHVEGDTALRAEHLDRIESTLRDFLTRHRAVLRLDYDELLTDTYTVTSTAADELRQLLQRWPLDLGAVRAWSAKLSLRPAAEAMGPLSTYAVKLGERLGKELDVTVVGGDVLVDARTTRAVFRGLTHLVRNAVDHGIEEAEERLACGKPVRGSLTLSVAEASAHWCIRVGDDGRGILTERIAQAAVRQELTTLSRAPRMTQEEAIETIFAEGFSTHDAATETSGRGMGMSAIRATLQELGGSVVVETVAGTGTVVDLRVPKPQGLNEVLTLADGEEIHKRASLLPR
jgi:two-component system chemotaxis sensor kinase CheA